MYMYGITIARDNKPIHSTYAVEATAGEIVMSRWTGGVMPHALRDAAERAIIDGAEEVDIDGQIYILEVVDLGDLRVEVDGYVATLYRDGERIGQWQAGVREYAAAGVEWPGCSCGEDSCRHGLAYYWGETLSPAELDALAATRV